MAYESELSPSFHWLSSLDRVVHEPARLLVLAILSVVKQADFVFLLNQTGMTSGNFATHIGKLEDAGLVEVSKQIVNKKPLTTYAITDEGRIALDEYKSGMKQFLNELD